MSQTQRTLVIDADSFAYMAAAAHQNDYEFDGEKVSVPGNIDEAFSVIEKRISMWVRKFKADPLVTLSCPSLECWRVDVLPSYKGNRVGAPKPLLLAELKDLLRSEYTCMEEPRLEADDLCGILSTSPISSNVLPGKKLVISIDKDLNTVPGWLYDPNRDAKSRLIPEAEADLWHMYQTLVGDATDGYKGCPGIGPVKAKAILHDEQGETSWPLLPEMWRRVVAAFEAKGLTEEDALVQARVARILRHTDYDFSTKTVRLWGEDADGAE